MKVNEETIQKVIIAAIFGLVMLFTGLLFYFLALRIGGVAKENQAYNRYNACVLSIPALERNKEIIDKCWRSAQEDTGIEVKRYDQ